MMLRLVADGDGLSAVGASKGGGWLGWQRMKLHDAAATAAVISRGSSDSG
jgi:hypothetical protein